MQGGVHFEIVRLEQRIQQWAESAFLFLFYEVFLKGMVQGLTTQDLNRRQQTILDFPDEFRKHLLKAADEPFNPKFAINQKVDGEGIEGRWYGCSLFARQLHEWNKKSRVVYQINDDLRVLLQSTSFRSATWGSILWPFDSFILTLEKPVEIKEGVLTDTILFAKLVSKQTDMFTFSFLPVGLENYEPLTDKQKERFFLMAKRGQTEKIKKMFAKSADRRLDAGVYSFYCMINSDSVVNVGVSDIINKTDWTSLGATDQKNDPREQSSQVCQELAIMVAAFALYLTTLPPGEGTPRPLGKLIPPAIKRDDPRLISQPSHICRLTSTFKLSPEEKEEFEDAMKRERTGMVVPHWRRGYFRRPSGFGHDPNAPRTVMVKATFVNKHHLPKDTLPGGAFVQVEEPEDQV